MALRSKDLMIGDWVHVEAHRGFDSQNVRVETIPDASSDSHFGHIGTFLIGGDDDFRDVEDRHLSPIPLTPEILEKNGFERCVSSIVRTSAAAIPICNSNQFAHKDYGDLRIIDRGIWHFSLRKRVVCDTEWYEIHEIKYVHELQHALRLCGIDKTIEL